MPFYHQVKDEYCSFSSELYASKTKDQFIKELDFFLANYSFISLSELIQIKKNNLKLKKPSFHLTFDDGLANFYHIVAPILQEKNITATVFLNTDFIDNKTLFYRYKANLLWNYYKQSGSQVKINFSTYTKITSAKELRNFLFSITYKDRLKLDKIAEAVSFSFDDFLRKEQLYLTIKQIKELQNSGFTFGAHSKDHPLYAEIDLEQQLTQTIESLSFLETEINVKHRVFSFPFHDIGVLKDFFHQIKPKIDLSFGTSGVKKDEFGFHLQRLDMEKSSKDIRKFILKSTVKNKVKSKLSLERWKRN